MSPKAKLSLLEIEEEVEAHAREWHRQQLQKRLQQAADELFGEETYYAKVDSSVPERQQRRWERRAEGQ